MTDLDDRISEYAKWIESRYDDSHELRVKGKNGYIDGRPTPMRVRYASSNASST